MNRQYEVDMFGETVEQMVNAMQTLSDVNDPIDTNMYAMAILSDAQEEMKCGNIEVARQYINKAKYFMAQTSKLIRKKEMEG